MRALRKMLTALGAIVILLTTAQWYVYAQNITDTDVVEVVLPTYKVNVDGKTIDNSSLMYPIINYNAVTYFPLTWSVGKGLGLGISWDAESGLAIESHKTKQTELSMEGGSLNSKATYEVMIPRFPVTIDGHVIDNEKELYPLLVFRNVTYFPMTWDYTVGTFGWKTTWDRSGFSIYTGLVLDRISYDDDTYLYVDGFYDGEQGIMRLRKDFEGNAQLLTEEESDKIREAAAMFDQQPPSESKFTVIKGDSVYYKDVELMNSAIHRSGHPELYDSQPTSGPIIEYSERSVKGPAGMMVINLALHPERAHVANDPDTHTFLVKDDKAIEVKGFNLTIHATKQAANGLWLWSYAPASFSPRSSGLYGKLLWIDDNGNASLWNDSLQSGQLRVLRADQEELMVQAYENPGAYCILRSDGSYQKIADAVTGAYGYVDHQGVWYELKGSDQVSNDQLRNIKVPFMVMAGDHDTVDIGHLLDVYRLLPQGTLAIVPNSDHFLPVMRYQQVLRLLNDFLD